MCKWNYHYYYYYYYCLVFVFCLYVCIFLNSTRARFVIGLRAVKLARK
jgi:hypothetical protein